MRILIINPPRVGGLSVVREERYEHRDVGACYPPLDLLIAGGILKRHGHEVRLIDANRGETSEDELIRAASEFEPKVIVSRIGFDTQNQDADFLGKIRWVCDAPLVIRNRILSESNEFLQRFLDRHVRLDFFCKEPLSDCLVRAVSQFDRTPQPAMFSPLVPDGGFDPPDYSLLENLDGYHTGVFLKDFCTVLTSRGCPHSCRFCAYADTPYMERPVEAVVSDLEYLKQRFGLKHTLFFDDNFALNEERAIELSRAIENAGLGITWAACMRADVVTLDAMKAMKKAGCVELAVGIESGDKEILERNEKGIAVEHIRQAANACRRAGVLFYAMVILGLPGETAQSIEKTIHIVGEIKPFYTQFCFSTPFPNTPNFAYYRENDLLLSEDPERFFPLAAKPVVRTKALTAPDLATWRKRAYKATNLNPIHLIRQVRLLDWKWNLRGLGKIARLGVNLGADKPIR